jgi:hypothetical protein
MLTIVAGNGANCTEAGTTTPTPMLKLTLAIRGALLLWITVCRISVLCCGVRLTTGAVAELDDEAPGAGFCDDPVVAGEGAVVVCAFPGWFVRPGWALVVAGWSVAEEGAFAPVVGWFVEARLASPLAGGGAALGVSLDERPLLGAVDEFELAAGALLGALPWLVPGEVLGCPCMVWPFATTAENISAEIATAVEITGAVMAFPQQ